LFAQTHFDVFTMANVAKASSSDFAKPIEETGGLSMNMSSTSLDRAAVYLHNHSQLSEEVSINSKMLLRKIDWRLLPLAFACTAVQFIDKFTINVRFPAPPELS
jgi:hypothetical protein